MRFLKLKKFKQAILIMEEYFEDPDLITIQDIVYPMLFLNCLSSDLNYSEKEIFFHLSSYYFN